MRSTNERNMEQVRLAGRMRRYINSALMRNGAAGLSRPNPTQSLTTSVPAADAAGDQVVDADGNQVTEKEAVVNSVQHMQHKTKRINPFAAGVGYTRLGHASAAEARALSQVPNSI